MKKYQLFTIHTLLGALQKGQIPESEEGVESVLKIKIERELMKIIPNNFSHQLDKLDGG